MPPILRFILRRFMAIPISLLIITALLYGLAMLTPANERVVLYLPKRLDRYGPEQLKRLVEITIERHGLDDPYPVQYVRWLGALARGNWGWSSTLQGDVLDNLLQRTPVTAELTLYSLLLFLPTGLVAGMLAGWRKGKHFDIAFRTLAFTGLMLPPFILGILLMAIFYIRLGWFPPERLSYTYIEILRSPGYVSYTGLLTIDGLLNGRPDLVQDALRHLVLPVISLSLVHWATLGQVARVSLLEERQKDYLMAGRARGLPENTLLWRHSLRNILAPALTSSALSAASLFTGVIVVERTFSLNGISELILTTTNIPDIAVMMGFAVYSVIVVLLLMFLLDIIQAVFDPRIRNQVLER